MAADPSYDAFIAQLERKHQAEPPGHNSYFEVFNEASRLIGHLKKGLNISVHRERQSEVRVAAQSWQDSCYNDRTGPGIDILDWQPRYATLDPKSPEGGSGGGGGSGGSGAAAACAVQRHSKSAAAASSQYAPSVNPCSRRSHTSPPSRRPAHAAAAAAVVGELGSPSAPAADRALSEPLTRSYRPPQPHPYGGGNTTGSPAEAVRGSAGAGYQARRATDSVLPQTRRGAAAAVARAGARVKPATASGQRQHQPQQGGGEDEPGAGEEGGGGGEGEELVAVRERSFLGSQVPQRLPALDEPSGPVLNSPTAGAGGGGSRVDEAIRIFARTAYEPGEHRHSLLLPPPSTSEGGAGGSGLHLHLGPLPLAPVPRLVPRHVTEAVSALVLPPPAGFRGSVSLPPEGVGSGSGVGSGGGGGGLFGRSGLEPTCGLAGAGLDVGAVGGGRQLSVTLPQPHPFHPHPPDDPGSGAHPRPQTYRFRASGGSFTGPSPAAAMAAAVAAGGHASSGGGECPSPPPLAPPLVSGRAARRVSACGLTWETHPDAAANCGAMSPARVRAAAAAPAAVHLPQPGVRAVRESSYGASCGAGEAQLGSPASATGGLIKGYFGGGPLDYHILDKMPRLGLDAPRVKWSPPAAATADSNGELIRRGLQAAPAGLGAGGLYQHASRPGTAKGSSAGDVPSPEGGGKFVSARRASCTGALAVPPVPPVPAAGTGIVTSTGGGGSLGPMLITREQVDSYVATQAPVQAKAQPQSQAQPQQQQQQQQQGQGPAVSSGRARTAAAATGSTGGCARTGGGGGMNVIGTRGSLADEARPPGPRELRREVASGGDTSAGGRSLGS